MSEPLVHVLVINWNGLEHLEECFTALSASTYSNARFVLLDNGSTDNSAAFVEERFGHDGRVEIVRIEENCGWSGANNVGLARALEAGADYALLLNNDTSIDPRCIELLVAHAERDGQIGALAPKLLLYDTPELINSIGLEASYIGAAWDRGLGRLDDPRWDEVVAVPGACGAGYFVRMAAVREAGLLASEFEIYLDDYDHGLRLWNAGYRIETCPDARIRHKYGATMGRIGARKYYLNTRNRFRVMERNFPMSKSGAFLPAVIKGECRAMLRSLLDGELGKVWAHKRAWLSAMAYAGRARQFRKAHSKEENRFWELLRGDRSFFSGIEFPEHGWYRSREVGGMRLRPMSKFAHYMHEAGKLRVVSAQPYSNLGAVDVAIESAGEVVEAFRNEGIEERVLELPRCELIFRSNRIFFAEDTGESIDIGGWFLLEPC